MNKLIIGTGILVVFLLVLWIAKRNRKDKKNLEDTLYQRDFPPNK